MSLRNRCRLSLFTLEDRLTPSLTPVGPEFRVNIPTEDMERFASVAAQPDGNFVAAFYGTDENLFPNTSYGITVQRYRPDGTMIGTPIAAGEAGSLTDVTSIATDANGNFVIVWTKFPGTIIEPPNFAILARTFDASGTPLGPTFIVNQTSAYGLQQGRVAYAPNGDFIVTWTQSPAQGQSNVMVRRFTSNGTPLTNALIVSVNERADMPRISITSDGSYVVGWQSLITTTQGNHRETKFCRFGPNDQLLVAPVTVSSYDLAKIDLITLPNHNTVVCWKDWLIAGQRVFQWFDPMGAPLGSRVVIGTGPEGASLAYNPNTGLIVTWSDTNGTIQAKAYNVSGTLIVPQFQVNTNTANYYRSEAMVAVNKWGDAMFAWASFEQDGYSWGVYSRNYYGAIPHSVAPPTIDGGTASRSSVNAVDMKFSEPLVLPTIPSAAYVLTSSSGTMIPVSVTSGGTAEQFKVTFPSYPNGLPDGRYTMRMLANQVHDAAGQMLDGDGNGTPGGDYVVNFHKLAGDFNGDAIVDHADVMAFASGFGGVDLTFDLDGDGVVGKKDLIRLRNSFGNWLLP